MGTEAIDWLIVGGGIHGTHIAARLVGEAGLDPARLLIVDDRPRLLARWRARTANTGMRHLRSPAVRPLDLDPWDLERFASGGHRLGGFAPPYARPALALFDAHCDRVVERYLAELELGPVARNIVGARHAARRILPLAAGAADGAPARSRVARAPL